jgi:NodT family efflux transporter outer membrane factor (OMF) lipoprotein
MKTSVALVLLLVCGCASGPNFVRPAVPQSQQYLPPPDTGAAAVATSAAAQDTQRIVLGAEVSARWWSLFDSDALNAAVAQALDASPTLLAAKNTLAQSQELIAAASGAQYPRVDATGGAGRQKYGKQFLGPLPAPPPFTYFAAGAVVNYTFDFAGGVARSLEERRALFEYQRQELRGARLALSGNVVAQGIAIAAARERIRAINELLAEDRRNLQLVQASFAAGNATRVDVLFADSELAADETLLPPASQELAVARHALAVLVGRTPAEWTGPDFDFSQLRLPPILPVSLPSELARRRPDILAAEAQLHAATAEVGVATANLYPHITLSASAGQQALTMGTLFASSNAVWSLTSGLTAPVFDGGTLRAARRADTDAMQASAASYQDAVLKALQQVADVLCAIDNDAQLLSAESHALDTAQKSLTLTRESYRAGNVGVLQVVDAERLYQRARLEYVRAETQRYADTAQLYLALGGTEP